MDRIDKGNLSVEEGADVQRQVEEVRARIAEIEGVEAVAEAEPATVAEVVEPATEVVAGGAHSALCKRVRRPRAQSTGERRGP